MNFSEFLDPPPPLKEEHTILSEITVSDLSPEFLRRKEGLSYYRRQNAAVPAITCTSKIPLRFFNYAITESFECFYKY